MKKRSSSKKLTYLFASLAVIVFIFIIIVVAAVPWFKYGHVNPYLNSLGCNMTICHLPTGIASYGIYANNNTKSYSIRTSALEGQAYISNMVVYNPPNSSVPANSSSLQLNGVLVTRDRNGTTKLYWLQLVEKHNNKNHITFDDFIFGINDKINEGTVNGNINCRFGGNPTEFYHCYILSSNGSVSIPGNLPLRLDMELETHVHNNISVESSTVRIFGPNQTILYTLSSGNFSITDDHVSSSYFLVEGKNYTISHTALYYDAEFVLGGYDNSAITNFTSFNATLGLKYYNSTTSAFDNFPSYYNFGADTAETTNTLTTTMLRNNSVKVTVGKPDYGYIGNSTAGGSN